MTSADRDILINQGLSNELTRMFEWGDCGMNASLITMLEGFKDPRLPLYVTKNQAAVTCEDGSTIEEGQSILVFAADVTYLLSQINGVISLK